MADSSPSAGLSDRAAQILQLVGELADAIRANEHSSGDETLQRVASAWKSLLPAIVEVGESLPADPDPVADWIREVGRVSKWFDDAVRQHCLADVLFRFNCDGFLRVEEEGRALLNDMAANQDAFAVVNFEPVTPVFSLLDRFPATPAGHVAFLEMVRDEIHYAAEAKRQQFARGYSFETLASMVRGIKWVEAGQRLSVLSNLAADATNQVASVLQRELTPGTVERIDELLTPAVRALLDAWEDRDIPDEFDPAADIGEGKAADPASDSLIQTKTKRSTERGEGRAKLVAALTKHHKYADGSCLNLEYIGNNELARLADVSESTASEFFKKQFGGHSKYRAICTDAKNLVTALKLLNQEFAPHHLFGAKPPGESEDEEVDEDEE